VYSTSLPRCHLHINVSLSHHLCYNHLPKLCFHVIPDKLQTKSDQKKNMNVSSRVNHRSSGKVFTKVYKNIYLHLKECVLFDHVDLVPNIFIVSVCMNLDRCCLLIKALGGQTMCSFADTESIPRILGRTVRFS